MCSDEVFPLQTAAPPATLIPGVEPRAQSALGHHPTRRAALSGHPAFPARRANRTLPTGPEMVRFARQGIKGHHAHEAIMECELIISIPLSTSGGGGGVWQGEVLHVTP